MPDRTVVCIGIGSASRSLTAEALFNAKPPAGGHAESTGTEPQAAPNPPTARILEEIGVALPAHPPRLLTDERMTPAAVRVTMGGLAGDRSPARLQTMEVRDRALPDPAGLDDAGFRAVRDDIRSRVEGLVRERGRLHRLRAQIAPRPASP